MFQSAPGSYITTLCAPRALFPARIFYAPRNPELHINCSAYDVYEHIFIMLMFRNPLGYIYGIAERATLILLLC